MFSVREATTEAEREAIYRLRYQVYIEEMGRTQFFADHEKRWIKEPLDDHAVLLGAFKDDQLIGTLRMNLGRDGALECEDLYDFDSLEDYPDYVSMTTKLMVLPEYRGSKAMLLLITDAYKKYLSEGIELDFIDANDHLVKTYERLGHIAYKGKISHPEYGDVTPMMLRLNDLGHLVKVRSPFAPILMKHRAIELVDSVEWKQVAASFLAALGLATAVFYSAPGLRQQQTIPQPTVTALTPEPGTFVAAASQELSGYIDARNRTEVETLLRQYSAVVLKGAGSEKDVAMDKLTKLLILHEPTEAEIRELALELGLDLDETLDGVSEDVDSEFLSE